MPSSTHHTSVTCIREMYEHLVGETLLASPSCALSACGAYGFTWSHGIEFETDRDPGSGICMKDQKYIEIYPKSIQNLAQIYPRFHEFHGISGFFHDFLHLPRKDGACPGCTDPHLQLRVLPLFHIQRQAEQLDQAGQRPGCLNEAATVRGYHGSLVISEMIFF